jgi:hypothetical protein
MQPFSVLLPVGIHVGTVKDAFDPLGVVPVDGAAEAMFKGDPGAPSTVRAMSSNMDSIPI